MNLYEYANSNPANRVDPSGLVALNVAGAIVGAIHGGFEGYYGSGGNWWWAIGGALLGAGFGAVNPIGAFASAGGALLGAGVGAGASYLAGGDVGQGALLGSQIGGIIGGLGSGFARGALDPFRVQSPIRAGLTAIAPELLGSGIGAGIGGFIGFQQGGIEGALKGIGLGAQLGLFAGGVYAFARNWYRLRNNTDVEFVALGRGRSLSSILPEEGHLGFRIGGRGPIYGFRPRGLFGSGLGYDPVAAGMGGAGVPGKVFSIDELLFLLARVAGRQLRTARVTLDPQAFAAVKTAMRSLTGVFYAQPMRPGASICNCIAYVPRALGIQGVPGNPGFTRAFETFFIASIFR